MRGVTTLMTGQMPGGRGPALDDDVDLVRDRALVERAQAGDRTAFDDLYQRYYRRLYRFCIRRLQDSHEAEDVAQEAFARAWRALPNFAGDRRFYPWLSVIASHLCTDVLRRRNRSTPVAEFHQTNVASTEDGGEERVCAAVDSDLIAQAFLRLSDRHQRILNLREGSGWSYQAIADHEGVGITAIETLLWRARQALKREFTTLAGSDGRLAGILGGVLGLSLLRRLLAGLGSAARKVGPGGQWSSVAAVGSVAAVSAAVVAGTVALALPGSTQPLRPTAVAQTDRGVPVSAAGANHRIGQQGGVARSTGRSSGGSITSSSLAGDGAAPGMGTVMGTLGSTVPGISSALGSSGGGSGLGQVANGLGTAMSSLSTPVAGLGSTLGNVVSTTTSPLTGLLAGSGLPLTGNVSVAGTSASALPGALTGIASSLLQTAAGSTSVPGSGATGSGTAQSSTSSAGAAGISCAIGTSVGTVETTVGGLLGGTGTTGSSAGCS